MANVALLQRTLESITDNSHWWDQGDWRHCFAGHALRLADGEVGSSFDIGTRAAEALGLDAQAVRECACGCGFAHRGPALFDSHRTLDDLTRLVAELVAGTEVSA